MAVNVGVELIESAMRAVVRVPVAGSEVILDEKARPQAGGLQGVAADGAPAPGANTVSADVARLAGDFGVIIEARCDPGPTQPDDFLIEPGQAAFLCPDARCQAPENVWLDLGARRTVAGRGILRAVAKS